MELYIKITIYKNNLKDQVENWKRPVKLSKVAIVIVISILVPSCYYIKQIWLTLA